jgi:hypothetical protein
VSRAVAVPAAVEEAFDWKNPDYAGVARARVERLDTIRGTPGMVEALREHYKQHPADFIADWGWTFDPRNPEIGLPAAIPFVLFKRQREFIDWLHDGWKDREDGLVEKSRDMGVSWLCMAFGIWMWTFYPGVAVGFGSRKEEYVDDLSDPKSLFWKGRFFVDMLPVEFQPEGWNPKVHAPFMTIRNPVSGSVIVGEAGDNIGRGGRNSVYFVDEAAHLERPQLIDAALSQTTNCRVDVSTPNGSGNPFYKKRHGGKVAVFVFDWRDDPRKGEEWYQEQVRNLDAVVLAQEVDRSYEASVSDAFIPAELVQAAMSRAKNEVVASGGLRFGLDVARFGDDKCVLTVRRGRLLIKQIRWAKLDLMSTAGKARFEIDAFGEKPEQIAVDTVGMGAGVADMLRAWYPDESKPGTREVRKIVVDVDSGSRLADGRHYNVRAFMAAEVKEWLKGASIPKDEDLRVELTSLKYGFRAGELLMESKDDAKRRGIKSPDGFDSLALTFAQPTIPKRERAKSRGYEPAVNGVM